MGNWVFSDEYNGERHTYYSPLRPFQAAWLPDGIKTIIVIGQDMNHITLDKALPKDFIDQWSLEEQS